MKHSRLNKAVPSLLAAAMAVSSASYTQAGTSPPQSQTSDYSDLSVWHSASDSDMIFSEGDITLQGSSKIIGDAGTNSTRDKSVRFDWSTFIDGDLWIGPHSEWSKVATSPKADVGEHASKKIRQLTREKKFAPPAYRDSPALEPKGNLYAGYQDTGDAIIDKSGAYSNISVTKDLVVNIGDEDLNITAETLSVSGDGQIILNRSGSGHVNLFVTDSLELSGSGKINSKGNYDSINLYYSGNSPLRFGGNTRANMSLYAQTADISLSDSAQMTGSIVTGAKDISLSGNSQLNPGEIYALNAALSLSGSSRIQGVTVSDTLSLSGTSQIEYDDSMSLKVPEFKAQKTPVTEKLGSGNWGMYYDFNRFDDKTFKANFDYDLSMLKKLPFTYFRLGFVIYDNMVDQNGNYNFSRLDYAVDETLKAGKKVILPLWFVNDGIADKGNIDYHEQVSNMRNLITAMVKHYSGKGIIYEALDEANSLGHFWMEQWSDDCVEDILALNQHFVQTIQREDPTAVFMAGDFAWPKNSSDGRLDRVHNMIEKGYLDYGTYGSFHPYTNGIPEQMLGDRYDIEAMNHILTHNLLPATTEFGFPHNIPNPFNGNYTRQEQSDYTVRQMLLLDAMGFEVILPFTMDNSDKAWALQAQYYDAGVGEGKDPYFNQVGDKIQDLFGKLDGYTFETREISESGNDYIFRYTSPSDDRPDKIVYWTVGSDHELEIEGNTFIVTGTPEIAE